MLAGSSGRSAGAPNSGSSTVARRARTDDTLKRSSWCRWRPPLDAPAAMVEDLEAVRIDALPRRRLAVRPFDLDLGRRGRSQPEMKPPELAAAVAAADRDLPPLDQVADPDHDGGADRVHVRGRRPKAHGQPVAGIARGGDSPAGGVRAPARGRGSDGPGVPPDPHRRSVERFDEVEAAVEVEVGDGGAAPAIEVEDPGLVGHLDERAIGLAEKQVARVASGVGRVRADVALRDEEVDEAVVIDILEGGMPGRRWERL